MEKRKQEKEEQWSEISLTCLQIIKTSFKLTEIIKKEEEILERSEDAMKQVKSIKLFKDLVS
jgi:hypothetical protein